MIRNDNTAATHKMTAKGAKDDLYDVSDSTDWLTTPLKQFCDVESALRCQVCKDFFTTPMITSCSHTFCSLCIRRCLSNDGKCPACRAPEQELKLRSDGAVEGIVEAFQRARPVALEYARNHLKTTQPNSPKRKLAVSESEDREQPMKRTRSSNRIASARSHYQSSGVDVINEVSDDDYQPENDDGLIACPICGGRMPMEAINPHLDRCAGEPPKLPPKQLTFGSSVALKPIKPLERLPHLSYSLFKETALRKKLLELGISPAGNKPLLERRHTEWVTLWNANCDSSRPRKKVDLLQDLDIWERTQGGAAPSANSVSMGNEVRSKDFDAVSWSAKHDDSFQSLIENARRKAAGKGSLKALEGEPKARQCESHIKVALTERGELCSETLQMRHSSPSSPTAAGNIGDSVVHGLQEKEPAADSIVAVDSHYMPNSTDINIGNEINQATAVTQSLVPPSTSAQIQQSQQKALLQDSRKIYSSDIVSVVDNS